MSEEIKNGFEKLDDAVLEEVNGGSSEALERHIANLLQNLSFVLNHQNMESAAKIIAELKTYQSRMSASQRMLFEALQLAYRNLKNA